MPILKHGEIITNEWIDLDDEQKIPDDQPVTVSVDRWNRDRDSLVAAGQKIGLRIRGDTDVGAIAPDLDNLDMIAVSFPGIADGRGYSQARLLRHRYGFTGELRATGPLIRDVFPALERVGFDTIEARDQAEAEAWADAVARITVRLQPDIGSTRNQDTWQTAAE